MKDEGLLVAPAKRVAKGEVPIRFEDQTNLKLDQSINPEWVKDLGHSVVVAVLVCCSVSPSKARGHDQGNQEVA
jgi:hypothetical protein